MIVDANLLLYAKVSDYPQHAAAHAWLEGALAGPARVGMPWPSLLAFVRIVTNARVFRAPLAVAVAWRQVERWLGSPSAWVPTPGPGHARILGALLQQSGATGALVPDAHLAALAIEHGTALFSTDSDFARFGAFGLDWRDPLARP